MTKSGIVVQAMAGKWAGRWISAPRAIVAALLLAIACLGTIVPVAPARAAPGITALSCTPPRADPEIAALARALNYNLNLIYEYVYYNIDYSPTFGLKKGPLGTYLDGRGNNMDQNMLFVALLRQSCLTANYRYGVVTVPAAAISNLLGVNNDAALISGTLGNGGIPSCVMLTSGGACVTSGGAATTVNIQMVWTEVISAGTTYELDPSFKSYQNFTPIAASDLASATGYSQSDFLNAATSGSSAISGMPASVTSVKSLNKANITTKLNTYSAQLAAYIKANKPTSSMKEIFGGRTITNGSYDRPSRPAEPAARKSATAPPPPMHCAPPSPSTSRIPPGRSRRFRQPISPTISPGSGSPSTTLRAAHRTC